jgi:predicted regulator of Ras-like GTPase activity (Roadblock/LC7/MglB family)
MAEDRHGVDHDVRTLLSALITKCGALTGLMVTKEGVAIADAGDTSYMNATAMAALVAGMFSATKEVARMVGETQFSILLQQGETRHIHIGLVNEATMLVIIFEDYQRMGLVRYEARKASPSMAAALERDAISDLSQEPIATPQFKEYALNLIDRIFESK